jgi:hypothetical protein
MDKFKAAGATVVGVSLDSIERLNDFSADPEYCAGQLPVASDTDGSIARSYELDVREGPAGFKDTRGVDIDHGFASRDTFVVGADGTIVGTVGGVSPEENVMTSLEITTLHYGIEPGGPMCARDGRYEIQSIVSDSTVHRPFSLRRCTVCPAAARLA